MDNTFFDRIIVGGGLSGLIAALNLSQPEGDTVPSVALIEQRDAWGGRLLLGGQRQGAQATPEYPVGSFPLALYGSGAARLWEGLQALLSDAERQVLNGELQTWIVQHNAAVSDSALVAEARSCFVVRKEWTPGPLVERGATECLTRFAAAALQELLNAQDSLVLSDWQPWKTWRKPMRDELRPFLETAAGEDYEQCTVAYLSAQLATALGRIGGSESPIAFGCMPAGVLCQVLAQILERRGVTLLLRTRVERCRYEQSELKYLIPIVGAQVGNVTLRSSYLVAALPLALSLTVVPREWLTAAQSRFVTKYRPRTAVALEIAAPHLAPEFASSLLAKAPLCRLLFPIERVQALGTSDGRLIFYGMIDYEVSMQTPAVRDVLSRIKRAFRRVFPLTELETFAKLAGGPPKAEGVRRDLAERLVLIPVAQSVAPSGQPVAENPSQPASGAGASASESSRFLFVGEHGALPDRAWEAILASASHARVRCSSAARPIMHSKTAEARVGAQAFPEGHNTNEEALS